MEEGSIPVDANFICFLDELDVSDQFYVKIFQAPFEMEAAQPTP